MNNLPLIMTLIIISGLVVQLVTIFIVYKIFRARYQKKAEEEKINTAVENE